MIVGTGIRAGAHVTLESIEHIRNAERLLYVVTEPITAAWLQRLNPKAETMDDLYKEGRHRQVSYLGMTKRILDAVRSGARVCAVFYGHPGMMANAANRSIQLARKEGYAAEMLPGISAEDCLFADLGVNPGDAGCQTFEATDFLGYRRIFDPTSALILYQVGAIGEGSVRQGMRPRPERMNVLTKYLRRAYPARHPVVLYEAASFPFCAPYVKRTRLERFAGADIRPMTTVYLPPLPQRRFDPKIAAWYQEP
jgi:precorrin-6B methylase 1